jgi:hypothetical protein
MTQNENRTTICLNSEDADVFRKLSAKTKINLIDLMHELAREINVMLSDGLEESDRISFMARADLAHSMVLLYFAPILTQFCQLPPNAQKFYQELKAKEDGDGSNVIERKDEISTEHMETILKQKLEQLKNNEKQQRPQPTPEKECPEA